MHFGRLLIARHRCNPQMWQDRRNPLEAGHMALKHGVYPRSRHQRRETRADLGLHPGLGVLEQVLIAAVGVRADLVAEHDAVEHVEGEDVGEAQDAPRHVQLLQTLRADARPCRASESLGSTWHEVHTVTRWQPVRAETVHERCLRQTTQRRWQCRVLLPPSMYARGAACKRSAEAVSKHGCAPA